MSRMHVTFSVYLFIHWVEACINGSQYHFHNDFVGGQFAAEVSESPIEEHAYSVRAWMHAEMKTMSVYKYVLLQAHIIYLHSSRRGGDLFS